MTQILDVYFGDEKAGQLTREQNGRFSFCYDITWLAKPQALPLSLSLPLRTSKFDDTQTHPFFANLLPENEIRSLIARHLGISEKNDFTLLEIIGGECAGAISIYPANKEYDASGSYHPLNKKELIELVHSLPQHPLLAGETGIRLSLAGAQNKLPIYFDEKQFFLPLGNFPSSHILKPPLRSFDASVSNEAFCMQLAKAINLPVAESFIFHDETLFYCTKRFDREEAGQNKLVRLHQEDFCQALGVMPEQKYESEGGPSLERCFTLLKKNSTQPGPDQMSLIQWVVFNYLIGNADGHAKNIALLFLYEGPCLAPFYDLFCTAIYPNISDRMAMKIGGENRLDWIQWRHWQRFAKEISVNESFVKLILEVTAKQIIGAVNTVAEKITEQAPKDKISIEKICAFINKQTQKTLSYLPNP